MHKIWFLIMSVHRSENSRTIKYQSLFKIWGLGGVVGCGIFVKAMTSKPSHHHLPPQVFRMVVLHLPRPGNSLAHQFFSKSGRNSYPSPIILLPSSALSLGSCTLPAALRDRRWQSRACDLLTGLRLLGIWHFGAVFSGSPAFADGLSWFLQPQNSLAKACIAYHVLLWRTSW